jgi:hypothetical protein
MPNPHPANAAAVEATDKSLAPEEKGVPPPEAGPEEGPPADNQTPGWLAATTRSWRLAEPATSST